MGLFGKNDNNDRQRNPDAVFGFRALAAIYILYLVYQTVEMYMKGQATSGIWLLIASIVVLGGGAVYILVSSYLSWRKEKAELAAQQKEAAAQEETADTENTDDTDE